MASELLVCLIKDEVFKGSHILGVYFVLFLY